VVKVQRPGIERVLRGDLDLLYLAARALETAIDEMQLAAVSEVIAEFEKGLLRELDFTSELENLETARALLDPGRAIVVPRPYRELSCRTVLVMELFTGVSLRTLDPDGAAARHLLQEEGHVLGGHRAEARQHRVRREQRGDRAAHNPGVRGRGAGRGIPAQSSRPRPRGCRPSSGPTGAGRGPRRGSLRRCAARSGSR
jgi:hypothetical protein